MTVLTTMFTELRGRIDDVLGRATMYRVVTIVLAFLAALAIVLAYTEQLDPSIFAPNAMALTLVVLVVASVGSSRIFGALWRVRPHTESAVITALLLWFLFWPSTEIATLGWLALAAVLANASKYVIAWRGRHLLNPAAAGAAALVILAEFDDAVPLTTWWAASEALFWPMLVGALLVLYRAHRLELAAVFVVVAGALTLWGALDFSPTLGPAIEYTVYSTPLVFFAGFMLSEPLTLAPRRRQQLALAVVAAVVFAWPLVTQVLTGDSIAIGPFEGTYELALLAMNIGAFAFGQRRGVRLEVEQVRPLGGDVHEVVFRPAAPVRFSAGQYLELDVPHAGTDRRGSRRTFTISSPPGAEQLTVAVRRPERTSSFKRALLELEPGASVRAASVQGDFIPPARPRPVAWIAGGIGVTPFLSHARSAPHDAVLIYAVPDAAHIAYRDELVDAGVPVVLVAPSAPTDLPAGWQHVAATALDADLVAAAVPDLAGRLAYISGPPAMVDALRGGLRRRCAGVRTDRFTGY